MKLDQIVPLTDEEIQALKKDVETFDLDGTPNIVRLTSLLIASGLRMLVTLLRRERITETSGYGLLRRMLNVLPSETIVTAAMRVVEERDRLRVQCNAALDDVRTIAVERDRLKRLSEGCLTVQQANDLLTIAEGEGMIDFHPEPQVRAEKIAERLREKADEIARLKTSRTMEIGELRNVLDARANESTLDAVRRVTLKAEQLDVKTAQFARSKHDFDMLQAEVTDIRTMTAAKANETTRAAIRRVVDQHDEDATKLHQIKSLVGSFF